MLSASEFSGEGAVCMRGVLCAVVVGLFFSFSVPDLNAARSLSRWGQRVRNFVELRGVGAPDILQKWGAGMVFVSMMGCMTLLCGEMVRDFIGNREASQPSIMLDTIIRFDDDIIGRIFHYTVGENHYEGEVQDWVYPYGEMLIYSSYEDKNKLVPIKNIMGKAIERHDHEYAKVIFVDSRDGSILYGEVLKVFDSGYYYVIAEERKGDAGGVVPLDQRRMLLVPRADITAIEPLPKY